MGWQPKSAHVSQLQTNPDGSVTGRNDCFPASLLRYLREAGKMDMNQPILDQLAQVDEVVRGIPDSEDNPTTDIPEAEEALRHYGVGYRWTTSYLEALAMQTSIVLVNGILLQPAQYPASWFNGENYPDHFILWLPYWNGSTQWFNDPLAPAGADVQYSPASVSQAFAGAFLLDPLPDQVNNMVRVTFTQNCALNSSPTHDPNEKVVLARAPKDGTGLYWGKRVVDGVEWWRCQFRAITGWCPVDAVEKSA